jgi:phosphoesterase RecJ-like protein
MQIEIEKLKALLSPNKKYLIVSHKSPDGDAVGSAVGWFHFLKTFSKHVQIVLPDPPSDSLSSFLMGSDCCFFNVSPIPSKEYFSQAEVLFCLDFNGPSRVGSEMESSIKDFKGVSCMIDHHPEPESFTNVSISDVQNSSTCQLLFECIQEMGMGDRISVDCAKALYLGIMTDTGSFRFPSVTAKTHLALAFLLEKGLRASDVHEQLSDNNRLDQLKLRGYATYEKIAMHSKYPLGLITLSKAELDRFNYQPGDTDGLVNAILSIKGIKMAILLQEKSDGVKISFRSKGEIEINQFAKKHFNGGGHKYASGGISYDSMQETVRKINNHIAEVFS